MKIYAEWMLNGKFNQGEFCSWGDYYTATFSPEVVILRTCIITAAVPGELHKSRSQRRRNNIRRTAQN